LSFSKYQNLWKKKLRGFREISYGDRDVKVGRLHGLSGIIFANQKSLGD